VFSGYSKLGQCPPIKLVCVRIKNRGEVEVFSFLNGDQQFLDDELVRVYGKLWSKVVIGSTRRDVLAVSVRMKSAHTVKGIFS